MIVFFAAKDEEALCSQQKKDWELTVAQTMNSLLPNSDLNWKVGKITRPLRYDLKQIPYDYTVEVTNTFKGLDLIDRMLKNYRWRFRTLHRTCDQNYPPKQRNSKRQNGCLRRPYK